MLRSRSCPVVVLLAAASLVLLPACSKSDGRTLPEPPPQSTTTAVDTPVVGQPTDDERFELASDVFSAGGELPERHTCTGEGISPPLTWGSAPPAAELALVVRDLDADGFVHWVVTGIDPLVTGLGEGGVPESAFEGANDGGSTGWFAPCPPPGETHSYELALHVLPEPLVLDPALPAAEAAAQVEAAAGETARLTATATVRASGGAADVTDITG